MSTQLAIRRVTVEEYHLMAKAGILTADDRVELREGQVVRTTPIRSIHQGTAEGLSSLPGELLGRQAIVHVQGPYPPG